MEEKRFPVNNKILAALSDQTYSKLLVHLEDVDLPNGKVLYEMGGPILYAYFPCNSLVSLVTEMMNGAIVEVAVIGNDGMTGIAALLGKAISPERAIVQIPNGGLRAPMSVIKEEFKRGGELHELLLAFTRKLMRQMGQTAACNATHTAEERLTRWLLMCSDTVSSTELRLTQEFMAEMLGTRRATVSVSAMVLQNEGFIKYSRGHIKILDREGLEAFSCECYRALKDS